MGSCVSCETPTSGRILCDLIWKKEFDDTEGREYLLRYLLVNLCAYFYQIQFQLVVYYITGKVSWLQHRVKAIKEIARWILIIL